MFSLQYYILLKHLQTILSIKATGKCASISDTYKTVDSVCFTIVTVSPVKILRHIMPASSISQPLSKRFFRIKVTKSGHQEQDDYGCGSALSKVALIKEKFVGIHR